MLNKKFVFVLLVILSLTTFALADAAPEPGYVRVANPLIVESTDDFAGYRFFLDSPGGFEEIKLEKGKTTTISSDGRGGSMRFTALIAIPVTSLSAFDTTSPDKLDALHNAVNDKKVEGVIELASHVFDAYVKKREAKTYKAPKYVLKTSVEKKIEAVETQQKPAKKTRAELDADEGESHMAANIAAGTLLSLSLIFGGVWLARRQKRG
jgi:hypothetical protein